MSISVASLTELNSLAVQRQLDVIAQMVQEFNPTIDVKRGVLHDLLLYNEAVLATATQTNIDRYNRARSLAEIIADPTLADDDIVNSVLSFYRIDRLPGGKATGRITFIMSSQRTFTIAQGAKFTANGVQFLAADVFTIRDAQVLVTRSSDRYLKPLGDGNYSFEIEVIAVNVGADGRLRKNTLLVAENTYGGLVKIYASSDFSGGSDIESNSQLLDRLLSGVAAQCLSNRVNMDALLLAQPDFAGIQASSIIGMGDAEMLRDRHWIWPTGGGGRIDWYVRTQQLVQSDTLTVTATLMSIVDDTTSTWQFTLDRDDAPGYYDVTQVLLADADDFAGGYLIESDTRSYDDSSDGEIVPDLTAVPEGVFSRYQIATIQFTDTDTPTDTLVVAESQQDYRITVRTLPLIAEIQDFVNNRRVRAAAADILVKAPVPCFVSLSFSVERRTTDPVPDTNAIARRLAEVVNTYGFTGRLPASILADAAHAFLFGSSSLSAIDIRGTILRPDGTIKPLRSSEVLLIPSESDNMVTPRTVAFFLDPSDVAIAVNVVAMPNI